MNTGDLSCIKWGAGGLLPAIAQDANNGKVLMLAWMNMEALQKSIADGYATYWSRSRKSIWRKGESSGHFLEIVDIFLDCDADCILLQVIPVAGIACHTGTPSCFNSRLEQGSRLFSEHKAGPEPSTLARLEQTIASRVGADPKSSYTASLLSEGTAAITGKVEEESLELIHAAHNEGSQRVIEETADLWYHILVLLRQHGVTVQQVLQELNKRSGQSGLEEKASRDRTGGTE